MKNTNEFLMNVVTPKVLEFNTLCGNTYDKFSELQGTYLGLIREEGKEYFKAVAEVNLKEQLDAVCDLLYVGTFYAFITNEEFWHEESWVSSLHSLITNPQDIQYSYDDLNEMLQDPSMYKFDIEGAFDLVTKSNFTKMPLAKDVDVLNEMEIIKEQGRYSGLAFQAIGDRVVFTATKDLESGEVYPVNAPKIVKPSTFKSVEDLGGLGQFIKGEEL